MSITLEQTESLSVIHLEGAIDIASAAELKEALLKALEGGGEVRVSLDKLNKLHKQDKQDKAASLDVPAVELLWAAGQAPSEVLAALADAGLDLMQVFQGASQV